MTGIKLPDKKLLVWRDELMELEGQLRRWRTSTTDFIADRIFKLANEMNELSKQSKR